MATKVREWVVDRFAFQEIYEGLLNRRVPRAHWYSGDGSTLLALLGIQVLTGAVLALTYSPATDSAYESVVYITEEQTLGWFIRGLHYWSAGAMMIVVTFHLLRQLLLAGYKSPREGTWITGVLLFFCVLAMGYTGYLLRWDERAIHGIRVMLHMLVRVPLIGEALVQFIQGGPQIGPRTLTRLYGVHVFIVPLIMFLLVGFHLYLVVVRGTITKAERKQLVHSAEEQKQLYEEEKKSAEGGETFFPYTMLKSGGMATLVIAVTLLLTLIVGPQQLFPEGNLTEPSIPAEEWWFWWLSGLIAILPPAVAPWFMVIFPVAVFVFLMLVPLIDRSPQRGVRKRPFWVAAVILVIIALLALTDYRRRSAFTGWPILEPPPVPAGMELPPDAERGRILFAQYGCNSCHPVAGHGRKVAVDFASLQGQLSRDKIREYILRPPPDVAMPPYEGRLDDDELIALIEFCHVVQTFPLRQ
jgi:ubiquinol-cytochrome c reductase cytochrome b subunit